MKNTKNIIELANNELIANGNLNIINEIFSSDYIAHAGNKNYTGHKFIKKLIIQLRSAIPDIHIIKIDILNQTKDTVAWQRTLKGTHSEKIMGIPPSGQKIKWNEIIVSRFDNNKIREEWVVSELAGYLLSKPPLK